MNITTALVLPPIPTDRFDWCAFVTGEEEALCGRGPTERAALIDLCEQLADMAYERTTA